MMLTGKRFTFSYQIGIETEKDWRGCTVRVVTLPTGSRWSFKGVSESSFSALDSRAKLFYDEAQEANKTKDDSQGYYYYAASATYPGAIVDYSKPLSLFEAQARAMRGKDIYATKEMFAQDFCSEFGGWSEESPTRDSNPKNAMHYHPITGPRIHIFYEQDKNLKPGTVFD